MLVIHKVEACKRCRGTTMWRLTNGNLHCERCQRRKPFPEPHPSGLRLAILFCFLVIVLTWITFAFAADRLLTWEPLRTAGVRVPQAATGVETVRRV